MTLDRYAELSIRTSYCVGLVIYLMDGMTMQFMACELWL